MNVYVPLQYKTKINIICSSIHTELITIKAECQQAFPFFTHLLGDHVLSYCDEYWEDERRYTPTLNNHFIPISDGHAVSVQSHRFFDR